MSGAEAPSASMVSAASLSWASSHSTPAATRWMFSTEEYRSWGEGAQGGCEAGGREAPHRPAHLCLPFLDLTQAHSRKREKSKKSIKKCKSTLDTIPHPDTASFHWIFIIVIYIYLIPVFLSNIVA